jgi:hypothetical protein
VQASACLKDVAKFDASHNSPAEAGLDYEREWFVMRRFENIAVSGLEFTAATSQRNGRSRRRSPAQAAHRRAVAPVIVACGLK